MAWVDIPLATGAGEGRSSFISDAELVNLMLVPNPPGSPRPFSIMNTPGLTGGLSSTSGVPGGAIVHSELLWFTTGDKVHTYNGSSVTTLSGTISTSRIPYRLVGAGAGQIVLTNGANTYVATTTTVSAITPPAGAYLDVTYMDGYTIYTRTNSDEFYISSLDDPTTISALDFSTADAVSDELVGCIVDHRELVLFGRKHIEFWYNSGDASFPFVRSSPGVAERGATGPWTIAKWDNAVFFLGDDLRVYRLEGYRPTPISTPWVERLIPGYFRDDYDAPMGNTYQVDGQPFYSLSFNSGDSTKTLKYNIATGLWHAVEHNAMSNTRAEYVSVVNFRVSNDFNRTYALVYRSSSGKLYQLEPATYRDEDAGTTDTTRTLTCPAFEIPGQRFSTSEVEILMEKVNGGSPGTVTLSYSDDGGTTYNTHSAQSTNQDRILWTRLGMSKRRIYRFEFATNARVAIHGVRANVQAVAA